MQLGVGGDADREAGRVGADELDEVAGVGEVAAGVAAVGGRVAAEGEDVLDAVRRVLVEQRSDVVPRVAHARQVGHGGERLVAVDADHDVPACAPGCCPSAP